MKCKFYHVSIWAQHPRVISHETWDVQILSHQSSRAHSHNPGAMCYETCSAKNTNLLHVRSSSA